MASTEIFFSDIFPNFEMVPTTNDIAIITNNRAIKDSILTLLQTNFGERLYHPEIGSNVPNQLFENANFITAKVLRGFIVTTILNFEPRVTVTNIDVIADIDRNEFDAIISYNILSDKLSNEQITLKLKP